jgi:hypothetical protein
VPATRGWSVVVPPEAVGPIEERLAAADGDVARDGDGLVATDPWGTTLRIEPGA